MTTWVQSGNPTEGVRLQTDIKVLLSAVVVMLAIGAVVTPIYDARFTASSLAGCIFLMLARRRDVREIIGSALLAILIAGSLILVRHGIPARLTMLPFVLEMLGTGCLATLGIASIWGSGQDREQALTAFGVGIFQLVFIVATAGLLSLTLGLSPKTLDLYLLSADGSLGFQPSFAAGNFLRRAPLIAALERFVYHFLPAMMLLLFAAQRNRQRGWNLLTAIVLAGAVGGLLYNVYPAVGPSVLFGNDYPVASPSLEQSRGLVLQAVSPPGTVRNCMPSLHFGWALLLWWSSRHLTRVWRGSLLVFVLLTAFATVGLGEHYLFDLVVAFPFALMIHAACSWKIPMHKWRAGCLVSSTVLTSIWLLILRFQIPLLWISPAIPWTLAIGTVLLCLVLECRLADQSAPDVSPKYTAEPLRAVLR